MIRVGIIGAGNWGKNHVRTFSGLDNVVLTAIADGRPEIRSAVEKQYPTVTAFGDAGDLISSSEVDAIVVATPSPTHADLACAALRAGKHVFVEKPLAISIEDAEAIQQEAKRAGRVLMVGHLLLYHSAVHFLKQCIDSGELGKTLYMYCERLNLGVIRPDENALWSLGPHDISIVRYLMPGEIADVSARGAAYVQDGVQDVVFVNLRYRDGRMANIHLSWLDPHKVRQITLVGDEKMAVFDDMAAQEKVRIYDKGAERSADAVGYSESLAVRSGDILIPKIAMKEPLRTEANHFIECIVEGKTPISDGQNGVDVVRLLDAAQRSLESGGLPVPIGTGGTKESGIEAEVTT